MNWKWNDIKTTEGEIVVKETSTKIGEHNLRIILMENGGHTYTIYDSQGAMKDAAMFRYVKTMKAMKRKVKGIFLAMEDSR